MNQSDRLSSVSNGIEVHEAATTERGCQRPLHEICQGGDEGQGSERPMDRQDMHRLRRMGQARVTYSE